LDLANIFLDSFLKGGFSTKKGHQPHDFGGSRLMAPELFQRGKPLCNVFLFLSRPGGFVSAFPVKFNSAEDRAGRWTGSGTALKK
jgi:hypothetical protein